MQMLKLFESITGLFTGKNTPQLQYDTGYSVDDAIERVVDDIDAKLRLVAGYRKKLHKEVTASLEYISRLVEQIPGPIDVSQKTFISDPEVRAYFATTGVLQDTFSCGSELKTFFEQQENSSSKECCALLCANKEEKHIMGLALEGDIIRREVPQTAINFSDYKILSPASNEKEVRSGIKKCIFDGLVTYALQHIASIKSESRKLVNQRRILHAQLRSRQSQGNGLSKLLAQAHIESEQSADLSVLLEEAETRLKNMTGDMDVFSFYLEEIRKILAQPENFIQLNVTSFRLNDMGIKVDDSAAQSANVVSYSELEITNVMKRVVTIVRYNRNDINCNKQRF
jgi:hypothetical protein